MPNITASIRICGPHCVRKLPPDCCFCSSGAGVAVVPVAGVVPGGKIPVAGAVTPVVAGALAPPAGSSTTGTAVAGALEPVAAGAETVAGAAAAGAETVAGAVAAAGAETVAGAAAGSAPAAGAVAATGSAAAGGAGAVAADAGGADSGGGVWASADPAKPSNTRVTIP